MYRREPDKGLYETAWYGPSMLQCRTPKAVVKNGGDPRFKRRKAEEEEEEEEEDGGERLTKPAKKTRRQVITSKMKCFIFS